ncbi:MAG: heavy metal translocating P-type ATPase [Clostridia bacterium]|nr:heavy metal translocating P-type ATPase [Clostridia bacterium]
MEEETRKDLVRIIAASVLLIAAWLTDRAAHLPLWGSLLLFAVPWLIAGYDVIAEAAENALHGEIFDENLLMFIATAGALCIGFLPGAEPEFAEAVFVMLFFKVGELFEELAEGKSRRSISQLMDIRPDTAEVERNGTVITVAAQDVSIGEIVVIRPGGRVPADGVVVDGVSSLDTSALTGESTPRAIAAEDEVMSGCINLSGVLRVRITRSFGESTASRILSLVESAAGSKSRSETFITRFARYYTPAVVICAVLLAFLPPALSGDFSGTFAVWLHRALTFLVISCPCALVISVPLTFFGGIGGASRRGILVKGSSYLETLSRTGTVVLDKTGTLTEGVFEVSAIHPEQCSADHLLHLAAHAERFSTHPVAVSLRQAYPDEADDCAVTDVEEIAGLGIRARVNGDTVCVGNTRLMDSVGAKWLPCESAGTVIHVSVNGGYAGHIVISDRIKQDAAQAVSALKASGVRKTVMLTGDRADTAKAVADRLGIDAYHAELLPQHKVEIVEQLLSEKSGNESLIFAGDGINDAPVLARADIGLAMGALGSEAAIEAADIVLMDDKPSKIAEAVRIARRTVSIARQNIIFAIAVKLAVLVLAGFGMAPMGLAVFADVGVTVLAVLNASRALRG